ncbi:VOC family protein [Engelhardtia mirabilis]|uniref:Glyoxalase-like domain protein n=1 Tax=Engelhardtia mirabilis TaxID=2528011 RepID=A0A518BEK5_9BACT|nr:Glyoxalase-like domain protein [Planctomycetes bacterium Pla133]QDU99750.1 Glyoxalase-like domain protein [Planctomycetes bacterium Pla86]
MDFLGVDHVQLAMPRGEEQRARDFFGGVLGMEELAKPGSSGGCWFRKGPVELHLGVLEPFAPATKAHPGIVVTDLDALAARLAAAGFEIAEGKPLAGRRRRFSSDCFGNKLEWIQLED